MTLYTVAPAPDTTTDRPRRGSVPTGTLLALGLVTGPLFLGVVLVQMVTRDGFDLTRHPISLLSVGSAGWVQVANFVTAGVLALGFAAGVRRVVRPGRAGTWGPRLLSLYGLGLIAGGVFVPDPALGFPVGTPDRIPDEQSWHSLLHAVAPPLAFTALVIACVVFARRFGALGERAWAVYCLATAASALTLAAWPSVDGASVRLAIALTIGFAWIAALALRLRREAARPERGTTATR